MSARANLDAGRNADWIRTLSWDLPTEPEAFLAVIGLGGMTLARLMTLPAAEAMPEKLKMELGV